MTNQTKEPTRRSYFFIWDRSSHNLFVCIHEVCLRREAKDEKEYASCKVEANKQSIFGKLLPYGPDFNWLTYYNVHKNCYWTRDSKDWENFNEINKVSRFITTCFSLFFHEAETVMPRFYIHNTYVFMCVYLFTFQSELALQKLWNCLLRLRLVEFGR